MLVYKITNKLNGKTYVGKTSKSIEERFKKHFYNHWSGETYLYRAMRKHGFDNFEIDIIEEVVDDLDEREKFWISELQPDYNMTDGGEGGDTSNSPNFIAAMKHHHENRTSYPGARMNGKKHSDETRAKQSEKQTEHWSMLSDSEREMRSKKIAGQNNGMFGKTPKNSVQVTFNGIVYASLTEAARKTGHSAKYLKKHGVLHNE